MHLDLKDKRRLPQPADQQLLACRIKLCRYASLLSAGPAPEGSCTRGAQADCWTLMASRQLPERDGGLLGAWSCVSDDSQMASGTAVSQALHSAVLALYISMGSQQRVAAVL